MNEPSKKAIGVRIRYVNIILICLAFVAAIVLIRSTMQTLNAYQNLQDDTGRYLRGQEDAAAMQEASDYLSRQVLLFAVTGDQAHVDLYFDEVNVTRRRENAIDNLRAIAVDRDSVDYLEEALRLSNELMLMEYRSMRLVYAAGGDALSDMPDPVADIELTAEELALSPDEKMHLAARLITDGDYQAYKDAISENVRLCAEQLTLLTQDYQISSADQLLKSLQRQRFLIITLLLMMLCTVLFSFFLIMRPLERNVMNIRQARPMDVAGALEIRFLAENYNVMFNRAARDREHLSFEATHDPLTGALNRKGYENALAENGDEGMALILVDVDDFKGFNDNYGHEMGDRVLKRVTQTLIENFRSEDRICRIGGDEFVVLMRSVDSSLRWLVERKIRSIANALRVEKDGMPGVTLSVGVAFSDRPVPAGTIFQDADNALYVVKERGRNGFFIYDGVTHSAPHTSA